MVGPGRYRLGRYEYNQLDEQREQFRLLRIDEGCGERITGQLITTDAESAPPFFSLSYCWGKQRAWRSIICDGRYIRITQSLEIALHRLKTLSQAKTEWDLSSRYFWIDQICVNQHDSAERSSQVKLMQSLYSRAIRTLIWLGDSRGTSTDSLALSDQIYQVFRRENPDATESMDIPWRPFDENLHDRTGLPDLSDDCWHQFQKFYALPWFRRIWVIQEVAESKSEPLLLVDDQIHGWNRFAWAASFLQRRSYFNSLESAMEIRNVDIIADIRRAVVPWMLSALLAESCHLFESSDPRDKIYGLIGLAAETKGHTWPKELEPDYSKDPSEVFRDVARYIFQQSGNLAMLSFPPHPWTSGYRWPWKSSTLPNIPSWVPHWAPMSLLEPRLTPESSAETTEMNKNVTNVTLRYHKQYKSSAGKAIKLSESADPNLLISHGVRLGNVETCSSADFELGAFLQNTFRTIFQWPWKDLIFDIGWIANGQWDVGIAYTYLLLRSAFVIPWVLSAWWLVKSHMKENPPCELAREFIEATTVMTGTNPDTTERDAGIFVIDENDVTNFSCCMVQLSASYHSSTVGSWRRFLLPLFRFGLPMRPFRRKWKPSDNFDEFMCDRWMKAEDRVKRSHRFYATVKGTSRARRVFILSGERRCIGIGPAAMRAGDLVCVLFGGEVPFIIRPEGSYFRLIGDCFVPRFRNGEAIEKFNSGELEEEAFNLR